VTPVDLSEVTLVNFVRVAYDRHEVESEDAMARSSEAGRVRAAGEPSWLILLTRLPSEPARHRMAVWRELRRSGAVALGSSAWAVPNLPATRPVLDRVRHLAEAAGGSLIALDADGHEEQDTAALTSRYEDARVDEWAEFTRDCGKYLEELDKEERLGKFTLAELEEEEQSLDRLRRWYRELRGRDLLRTTSMADASARLKDCEVRFGHYAEHVYAALGSPF
jgi:hypothetical protein